MTKTPRVSREVVIDGHPPQEVWMSKGPVVKPGCGPGKHCAAHGGDPFYCCRCGAKFTFGLAPIGVGL